MPHGQAVFFSFVPLALTPPSLPGISHYSVSARLFAACTPPLSTSTHAQALYHHPSASKRETQIEMLSKRWVLGLLAAVAPFVSGKRVSSSLPPGVPNLYVYGMDDSYNAPPAPP